MHDGFGKSCMLGSYWNYFLSADGIGVYLIDKNDLLRRNTVQMLEGNWLSQDSKRLNILINAVESRQLLDRGLGEGIRWGDPYGKSIKVWLDK